MFVHLIVWGVVFAVMVIAELASMQLVSIWFAAGALASFIIAPMRIRNGFADVCFFVVVSIVLLTVTRPLLKKFTVPKVQPTNVELDIGKRLL